MRCLAQATKMLKTTPKKIDHGAFLGHEPFNAIKESSSDNLLAITSVKIIYFGIRRTSMVDVVDGRSWCELLWCVSFTIGVCVQNSTTR